MLDGEKWLLIADVGLSLRCLTRLRPRFSKPHVAVHIEFNSS